VLPIPSIVVTASPSTEQRGTKQAVTAQCLEIRCKGHANNNKINIIVAKGHPTSITPIFPQGGTARANFSFKPKTSNGMFSQYNCNLRTDFISCFISLI